MEIKPQKNGDGMLLKLSMPHIRFSGAKFATLVEKTWGEDEFLKRLREVLPEGMGITDTGYRHWVSGRSVPSMKYLPYFKGLLPIADPLEDLYEQVPGERPN